MTNYDLEFRTKKFALETRKLMRQLVPTLTTTDDIRQLVRSSGSVAANYIEADESLSKKDFVYRMKICRKEVKESALWIGLLAEYYQSDTLTKLEDEANQLKRIFSSIIHKSS